MRVFAAIALGTMLCAPVFALEAEPVASDQPVSAPDTAGAEAPADFADGPPPAAPHTILAPKLTEVEIRLAEPVGSNFSQQGEHMAIEVDRDVVIDGVVVIAEGTSGVGEVVHAKASGRSGSGGELIVIANYINLDGRRIPLRSLQMTGRGRNRDGETAALSMAAGPFGLLVKGRPITFEIGYIGVAKLAEDTEFIAPATTTANVEPAVLSEDALAAPAEPAEEI